MSAIELNHRLVELSAEIDQINQETESLNQKRVNALKEDDQRTAQPIRDQLKQLQERLEDRVITKTAIESKLRVFKGHAQKAAEIRKQVAGELYPRAIKDFSKIQQTLHDLGETIQEFDQLSGTMTQLGIEHEKLIGEHVNIPELSHIIPNELRTVARTKLPQFDETLTLKMRSADLQETQRKQEAESTAFMKRQKTAFGHYFEDAKLPWPKCDAGHELYCIGGSADDMRMAFILNFRCPKRCAVGGAQGFVTVAYGSPRTSDMRTVEVVR